jgi:uncharacterized protein YdiU (UPF0061 family)
MQHANPVVIPRNHQVAEAIAHAETGDYGYFQSAFERWKQPYEWQDQDRNWAATPEPSERVHQTFCGT